MYMYIICVYVCIYIYVYIHTHMHADAHVFSNAYTPIHPFIEACYATPWPNNFLEVSESGGRGCNVNSSLRARRRRRERAGDCQLF